jgi:uncharacterized protein (TIGR04255 family)
MPLKFPQKPEVRLRKPPLEEVICQVKFPPILRISKETPIDFQDTIRDHFPVLEIEQGVIVQFPIIGNIEKPAVETSPKIYRFLSPDKKNNVSIATDFIALSTKKYSTWSDFLQILNFILKTFVNIYQPSFATRIGLRFINRFTKKNTKSKTNQELLALFREELTCLIQADPWIEPNEMLLQMLLSDTREKLTLRIGYGKENKEPFFLLDFDNFEEGQLNIKKTTERVNEYHTKIYNAFRWALLDESLARFEPVEEEG